MCLANPLQQLFRRFIVGILRHQFTAKGLGEEGRGQLVNLLAGGGVAGFEAIGENEKGFDAADDFVLLGEGGMQTCILRIFLIPNAACEVAVLAKVTAFKKSGDPADWPRYGPGRNWPRLPGRRWFPHVPPPAQNIWPWQSGSRGERLRSAARPL